LSTYLPELALGDIAAAVSTLDWKSVESRLARQQYERLGLDRALGIGSDLLERHGSLAGLRILDVGCNNGLIANVLAALGCSVVGIDNADVDRQGAYSPLRDQLGIGAFEFQQQDLLDFLALRQEHWDCVLLLSVAHHWETGYAMSGDRRYSGEQIGHLFEELLRRTRLSIYFECPSGEPGFEPGFPLQFLLRHCRALPAIRALGNTIGPNGYLRPLWALDME
jgi:SAM-dependent methyltransferase